MTRDKGYDGDRALKPSLPSGFQDFSPEETRRREEMLAIIRRGFEQFGAVPLQTSEVQRKELLVGEDDTSKRIWMVESSVKSENDESREKKALRYDLTVPLARFIAANAAKLSFPLRRYELGNVFRADRPAKGRYRGFGQFDFDIVGVKVGIADAEVVASMASIMQGLGVKDFTIGINNRKVLNALVESIGFDPQSENGRVVMQVMDKVDKIGIDGVVESITKAGLTNASMARQQADQIREFLRISDTRSEATQTLSELRKFFAGTRGSKSAQDGLAELELVVGYLGPLGVNPGNWKIDPSIARGLDYYTGTVMETYISKLSDRGSVCSGGRYDNLLRRFGSTIPCVGTSIGVDRLWSMTSELGLLQDPVNSVDVFVIRFSESLDRTYLKMATACRKAGLSTEVFSGYQDTSFRSQLMIAIKKRRAKLVLICGEDEIANGQVTIKNVGDKTQRRVAIADVANEAVREINTGK